MEQIGVLLRKVILLCLSWCVRVPTSAADGFCMEIEELVAAAGLNGPIHLRLFVTHMHTHKHTLEILHCRLSKHLYVHICLSFIPVSQLLTSKCQQSCQSITTPPSIFRQQFKLRGPDSCLSEPSISSHHVFVYGLAPDDSPEQGEF